MCEVILQLCYRWAGQESTVKMDLCPGMSFRLLSFICTSHRIFCSHALVLLVVLSFHARFYMIYAYFMAIGMEQDQKFQNICDVAVLVI